MQRILVPIDFSEPAEHALEVAAQIAKRQGAEIVMLHMLGLSEAVLTKNEEQEYKEAKYYLGLAKKRFKPLMDKPFLKGVEVKVIVQNYKDFKELDRVAQERHIDLIVMGSHGASGLNDFFVGSNTEKVVRSSRVPVLVVKMKNPEFKVESILFACDFNEGFVPAFKNVQAMATGFSARLQLVYVNTPYGGFSSNTEIGQRIAKFFEKAGTDIPQVAIYNDYSVEEGLLNYAKEGGFDILALPTRGRKPISHFLLGSRSIGEDVANHANLPVLTLKV
ncbi:universal stress protein [Pseudozobellia thermophila]|uniref:Nucleotide-binding universal stress protein, UspA family n=1 Tax=Pseudozobellia thermophila TaxID=192903 RepID=A0A1M6ILS6_9FLAO|nr:universal stress protein [Pseudozobellia thermophila]SHJ35315.1 Nucleotide-binding universal stress protein, UspA family [Pseudozobellia thermophila]